MLFHGALPAPRYVKLGDSPKGMIGDFSITWENSPAGGLTDFAKRKLFDHVLGGPTYTPAATVYAGLGTSLYGESLNEWEPATYPRQSTAFATASGGSNSNSALVTFAASVTTGPVTLTSFGIWDAPSGNMLVYGPLSTSFAVVNGDTATIPIGGFVATLQ